MRQENFAYNPPFLRRGENSSPTRATEPFEPAGPVMRELLKKDIEGSLEHRGTDAFMTGQQFSRYTSAMIEVIGGARVSGTKTTRATLDNPFSNVSKITFEHTEGDNTAEGSAKVSVHTTGPNAEKIEFTNGNTGPFKGREINIEHNALSEDEKAAPNPDADKLPDIYVQHESSAMSVMNRIYTGYMKTLDAVDKAHEAERLDLVAEENALKIASEEPVDIYVDPRLVLSGTHN